jgi:hypothetical protein
MFVVAQAPMRCAEIGHGPAPADACRARDADIGAIDASWVEENDGHLIPIGTKGIGEIGITGAAAAVANAYYLATGKRVARYTDNAGKVVLTARGALRAIWYSVA